MPDQGSTKPTSHQRYPKAGIGAWQTLMCTSIVERERRPKEAAGRGLTNTLLPRNLEEEEARHEKQRKYSENFTGQAEQTTSEIGNSLVGADVAWDRNLTD